MESNSPNTQIINELYRSLVLLGASNDLLGTVASWGRDLPENDVLANLRGWNDATEVEIKQRIEHCEKSSRLSGCTPVAA